MEKRVLKPVFDSEVDCAWCDKSISPRAACCPYCGHPGPGLEWKNNPQKISLKFTPPVLRNNICGFHVDLKAEWSISDGMVLVARYSTAFCSSESLKDYLLEIEAPPNAHVSVSLRMEDDARDDFDGIVYYPPMNEQGAIITEPGMYEIVLCKKPKKGWLITKYIDAFKINRIG